MVPVLTGLFQTSLYQMIGDELNMLNGLREGDIASNRVLLNLCSSREFLQGLRDQVLSEKAESVRKNLNYESQFRSLDRTLEALSKACARK
jgi:hypothetical protein